MTAADGPPRGFARHPDDELEKAVAVESQSATGGWASHAIPMAAPRTKYVAERPPHKTCHIGRSHDWAQAATP